MLRDCPPHVIWIETRIAGVFAADDSVSVTSIATSTACRLECRICREDCPGILQTQPLWPRVAIGHEAVHATVDLDMANMLPMIYTPLNENTEFW